MGWEILLIIQYKILTDTSIGVSVNFFVVFSLAVLPKSNKCLTASGFDYFAGGEVNKADNGGTATSIYDLAEEAGYTVINKDQAAAEAFGAGDGKVIIVGEDADGALPYEVDRDRCEVEVLEVYNDNITTIGIVSTGDQTCKVKLLGGMFEGEIAIGCQRGG